MDIRAHPRREGFWKGLLFGLFLAALAATGLAVLFPPTSYLAPDVPGDFATAPGVPGAPERAAEPEAPRTGGLLPEPAPAPLIAARPAAELPPGLPGLAPAPAPDIFEGDASGSPSLVPSPGN